MPLGDEFPEFLRISDAIIALRHVVGVSWIPRSNENPGEPYCVVITDVFEKTGEVGSPTFYVIKGEAGVAVWDRFGYMSEKLNVNVRPGDVTMSCKGFF